MWACYGLSSVLGFWVLKPEFNLDEARAWDSCHILSLVIFKIEARGTQHMGWTWAKISCLNTSIWQTFDISTTWASQDRY